MLFEHWLNLQLFAGEGAGDGGGEGAATGGEAADPGQQTLRELGVPENVLKRRANRTVNKKAAPAAKAAPAQNVEQPTAQDAAAEDDNPTEEPAIEAQKKPSWDEIKDDPEYNEQIQKIIQARVKSAKGAEAALQQLIPALKEIAQRNNLDAENLDYRALANIINNPDYYDDMALEMGVSRQTAMEIDKSKRDEENETNRKHLENLYSQGEELKKVFPTFDLRKEMENPAFLRMTSPQIGISVADAYHAIHRQEIQAAAMQVTAQKVAQKVSNSIQSGKNRPVENGTTGKAPSVTTFDYAAASPEQRARFKAHIRSEAAHGRKVFPGTYKG